MSELFKNKIGTGNLQNGSVTAAKLSATLDTGFVLLPLTAARVIAANDIPATAADGGTLSSNTDPILRRLNGATDKSLIISWATSSVKEIQWQVMAPPDIDGAANLVFHCIASMGGATDTPNITVDLFEGIGASSIGTTFAANMGTTPTEKTVTMNTAAIGTTGWNVTVVPGAHGSDTFRIHWAWLEYTRK